MDVYIYESEGLKICRVSSAGGWSLYGKANLVDLVKYKDAYEYAIINHDSTNKQTYVPLP